jgi:hypothetical protein
VNRNCTQLDHFDALDALPSGCGESGTSGRLDWVPRVDRDGFVIELEGAPPALSHP